MFRKLLLTAAVAVAVGVISPSAAKADFTLTLTSGSSTASFDFTTSVYSSGFIVNNTGAGFATVSLLPSTSFAGYTSLSFSVNTSAPVDSPSGLLSQNTFSITSTSASASLVVAVTSTGPAGFNPSNVPVTLNDSISSTTLSGGALSAATSTATGETSGSLTTSPIGMSTIGFLPSGNVTGSLAGIIDVTNTITIGDAPGTDNFTFSTNLVSAPAPSGLILAATVVPFFGLLRRRMRQMNNVVAA